MDTCAGMCIHTRKERTPKRIDVWCVYMCTDLRRAVHTGMHRQARSHVYGRTHRHVHSTGNGPMPPRLSASPPPYWLAPTPASISPLYRLYIASMSAPYRLYIGTDSGLADGCRPASTP